MTFKNYLPFINKKSKICLIWFEGDRPLTQVCEVTNESELSNFLNMEVMEVNSETCLNEEYSEEIWLR